MNPEPTGYITYLLRLWHAGTDGEASWRAALENPRSGERQVFGNLAALFLFLEESTYGAPPSQDQPCAAPSPHQGTQKR